MGVISAANGPRYENGPLWGVLAQLIGSKLMKFDVDKARKIMYA